MDLYWEIDTEVRQGIYNKKVKQHCAWCNAWIKKDMERYIQRGNCCFTCATRFNNILNGVRTRGADGRYHKVREYTEQEKRDLQLERLREVKEKGLDRKGIVAKVIFKSFFSMRRERIILD